jgi:hypothetical protein
MRRWTVYLTWLALVGGFVSASSTDCDGWGFVDVARDAGIDFQHERGDSGRKHLPETMGSGSAWLDADQDGRLDLYVVQSGPFPPDGSATAANRLYLNRGAGKFEPADPTFGAADAGYGQGVVAADYDGDGRTDLYVCNYGIDRLYRNLGQGRFEDATEIAGLGLDGWSSSAAFADADGDGDLDLYVTKYLDYDLSNDLFCGDPKTGTRRYCDPSLFDGAGDRYYRNLGDGRFEDATVEQGLADANGKGLGVLFTDLDGDQAPDLYVANDLTPNHLFRNDGSGRFESVSILSGAAFNVDGKAEAGMGLAVGDVDGDGDADLTVSNFDVETNTLYANTGGLFFDDVSAGSGFGPPSFNLLGFGSTLSDLNRDGRLDFYVTNGHIFERPTRSDLHWRQRDLMLLGDGRGGFRESRCGEAFADLQVGRGLAAADYDDDGDVDLAIVNNGGPLQLLRNDGSEGSWAGFVLDGRAPNRSAIGARVTLHFDDGDAVRWVTAGDSYQSSSDPRILFGWSAGRSPESVSVVWRNGESAEWDRSSLLPGRYHRIVEADGTITTLAPAAGSAAPSRLWMLLLGGLLLGLLAMAFRARRAH